MGPMRGGDAHRALVYGRRERGAKGRRPFMITAYSEAGSSPPEIFSGRSSEAQSDRSTNIPARQWHKILGEAGMTTADHIKDVVG